MNGEKTEKSKEFKKAHDKLKGIEAMKMELISNISHELRTPLTIAIGAIELAIDEELKEKRDKLLTMAMDALDRQEKIISNLAYIARIEKGLFKLNMEEIDIEQVITISKNEIEHLALDKDVQIEIQIKNELPKILGDTHELRRVFYNLLDNAIKFNKIGGRVIIEALRTGDFVKISIEDTGIGIPEEHLDNVFERFYQVDTGVWRKHVGAGTGLAVVKEIVEAHGGTVKGESEEDKGSKFTLMLPIHGKRQVA